MPCVFAARQGFRRPFHFAAARRCAVLSCLSYTFGGYFDGTLADVSWQIETNWKTSKRIGRNWDTLYRPIRQRKRVNTRVN